MNCQDVEVARTAGQCGAVSVLHQQVLKVFALSAGCALLKWFLMIMVNKSLKYCYCVYHLVLRAADLICLVNSKGIGNCYSRVYMQFWVNCVNETKIIWY